MPDNNLPTNQVSNGEVFYDIKPLAEFHPLPLAWILGLLALVLLYLLFRQRKKRLASKIEFIPLLSPKEQALTELRQLNELRQRKEIALREFSSLVSLVQRSYLERVFSFNACEQTVYELSSILPKKLRAMFLTAPQQIIEDIQSSLKRNLKFLEFISFGNKSADVYSLDSKEVIDVLESTKNLILAIEDQLSKINKDDELNNGV